MKRKDIYMNRELSWLKFNERVLEEAEDHQNPLCERMTFASIYQSNMDEFFMVRIGALQDQMPMGKASRDNKTGMTAEEQIHAILQEVRKLGKRKTDVYKEIMGELKKNGIEIADFKNMSAEEKVYLEQYFDKEVATLISPTVVGKRQPFPFLRNKEIYAVVILETKNKKERLEIIGTHCEECGH